MADRVASDAESSRRDRTKNEATRKRSAATKEQTKRPGFFGGIWLFFKQVIDEMKKVTYPRHPKPGRTSSSSLCLSPQSCFSLAYSTSDSVS